MLRGGRVWCGRTWYASLTVLGALALVACGGGADADGDSGPKFLGADELCDRAFSGQGAAALETVTGAKLFHPHPARQGVLKTAADLEEDFRRGGSSARERTLCSVYRKGGNDFTDARLTFGFVGKYELDGGDLAAGQHPYAMGKRASAGVKRSYLFFECATPKLPGSVERPALIGGEISDRYPPDKETRPLWEASLTALHSAALALAKQLGCAHDGGLPATPTLVPVSR